MRDMQRNMETHKKIRERFRFNSDPYEDNLPVLVSQKRNLRETDRETLSKILCELEFNKGVEVGVRRGAFTILMCQVNPNLEMTCIDPWIAYRHLTQERQDLYFRSAVENLTPFNVQILRKTSMNALNDFEDQSLDFVHIDGNHEFDFVCPDIIFWSQKVKKGGMMLVHDYCSFKWSGVVKAVDAYTHCHKIEPWYVTRHETPTAFWVNP